MTTPEDQNQMIVPVLDGDYSNEHLTLFSLLDVAMKKLGIKAEMKIFDQVDFLDRVIIFGFLGSYVLGFA